MGEFELDPRLKRKHPAWAVGLTDDFFRKVKSKDTFEVIDHIIARWKEVFPQEYKEQEDYIKDIRETRANPHASTPSKALRHLLSVPPRVMFTIEKVLGPERADFRNEKFIRAFAKRYPIFRVAEKI